MSYSRQGHAAGLTSSEVGSLSQFAAGLITINDLRQRFGLSPTGYADILINEPTERTVSPDYMRALGSAILRARNGSWGQQNQTRSFIERLSLTSETRRILMEYTSGASNAIPTTGLVSHIQRLTDMAQEGRLFFHRISEPAPAPAPAPTQPAAPELTADELRTVESGLMTLAGNMDALRGIFGFRGIRPQGALSTTVAEGATDAQRKHKFWNAIQAAVRQLNANEQAAGSGTTWEVSRERSGGTDFFVMTVNRGSQGVESMRFSTTSSRGRGDNLPDGLSMAVNTASLPERSGIGGRFYDALYGALSAAGIGVYFGGYTGPNVQRMPLNRLRAMLKWGQFHGYQHVQNYLAMGTVSLPSQSHRATPIQSLIHVLQATVQASPRYRDIKFIPETRMFRWPDGTERDLVDTTEYVRQGTTGARTVTRLSPDAVVLGAVMNSIADPNISTAGVISALTSMRHPLFSEMLDAPIEAEAPLPGLTPRQTAMNQAAEQATDDLTGDQARETERADFGQTIDNITAGRPFPDATAGRSIWRNVTGLARGTIPRGQATRSLLTSATDIANRVNRTVHDHLGDFDLWLRKLAANGHAAATGALNAMRLAAGRRNDIMRRGMEDAGGRDLMRLVNQIARAHNMSAEDAFSLVGFWLSAKRAPTANKILVERDARAVQAAQRDVDAAQQARDANPSAQADADLTIAQQQLQAATAKLLRRIQAVNNPQTRVARHIEGVGGYNNAQAAAMAAAVEARIPVEKLEQAAELAYNLNAFRVVVDLESGRKTPAAVAAFMQDPALEPLFADLQSLAANADAQNADSMAALDAKRREVMAAVRSNYVPLTGDPSRAMFEDLIYDARQPNVRRDYAMDGRTTSIPDDGLTSTFAGVMRSASYAGWAPFQDEIAKLYNDMTPEQREAAGLYRRSLDAERATGASEHGIARIRGGRAQVYTFRDQSFMRALRNETMLEGDALWGFMGQITRAYAYMATQLNPWFAPRNMFRDFWERSETIRRRRGLRDAAGNPVNMDAVARSMLAMMLNPGKAKSLLAAGWNYSLGRPYGDTQTSRYFRELVEGGAASIFRDRLASSRTNIIKLVERESNVRKLLAGIDGAIGHWNRPFDFAAPLASYIAMREAGIPKEQAQATALDLMNFRKRGEKMTLFSSLFAFAQPAVTGGANALGSLFDRSTGRVNKRGLTRLVAYTLAFTFARALMLSLSDEDEGGNKLAQQSDYLHDNFLLIPVGNKVVRVPLAFGLTRVANGMAGAMLGVGSGDSTPKEAMGQFVSGSLLPVFSPIEDVDIDGSKHPVQRMLLTFSPTWMKPWASVGLNMTPWGTKVVQDQWEDTDQFRSEQFGQRIPAIYGDVARMLRKETGLDFAPEEIRTLIRGIPMGLVGMAREGMIEGKGVSVLTNPLVSPYSDAARYFQFREAYDEATRVVQRRNAGETQFSDEDRKLLQWREWWDDQDKAFRARKSKITRDKSLSERAKTERKAAIDAERSRALYVALYRFRTDVKGRSAERVDVPRELTNAR